MLRSASQLGLREGMALLAEDVNSTFDDSREEWAQPLRFLSSEEVEVRVSITDAQNRFNLNRLRHPVSPTMIRTPEMMFADLITLTGQEVEGEVLDQLVKVLREEKFEFQDPLQLLSISPEFISVLPYLAPHLSALPAPETGFVPVNLNTVQPDVLLALLGPQFRGWVDTVVAAREAAPIPGLQTVFSGVPPVVQQILPEILDVQSDYFEIEVVAEIDSMQQRLRALVYTSGQGNVEVVQCRW